MQSRRSLIVFCFAFWVLAPGASQETEFSQSLITQIISFQINQDQEEQPGYYLGAIYLENFEILDSLSLSFHSTSSELLLAQAIKHSKEGNFSVSDNYWQKLRQHHFADSSLQILVSIEYAAHQVRMTEYENADSIYQILLDRFNGTYPIAPVLKALIFEQKGLLESLVSNYSVGEHYLSKAAELWEQINYPHPWKSNYWNHYGLLLTGMGQYDKAEEALIKARNSIKKGRSGFVIPYADATSNLGNLYRLLGDFKAAKMYYEEAGDLYHKKGLYLEYATILNNTGLIYDEIDSIDIAITYLEEAESIYRNQLGIENQAYATLLNNLAGLFDYQEEYDKAIKYYEQAIHIVKKTLGEKNIYYTTMLSNLALTHENSRHPNKAEPLYLKALDIRKEVLGTQHPLYAELLYNLASLYSYLNPDRAVPLFKESNKLELMLLKYYYSTFDEATRINYLDDIQIAFEKYYSLAVQMMDVKIFTELVDFSLAIKGLASEYSRDIKKQINQSDKKSLSLFNEWVLLRDSLTRVLVMNESQRKSKQISVEELTTKVDQLEKSWIRSSGLAESSSMTFNQFVNILQPNELVVDFIHFEKFRAGEWTDTIWYYAIIIDPSKRGPIVVQISDENSLQQVLDQMSRTTSINNQIDDLSKLLLDPLQQYFSGKEKVHFSASGLLHRVPLAGLRLDNKFLIEDFEINVFAHLRNFPSIEPKTAKDKNSLLIGGLNFGEFGTSGTGFTSLPASKSEVDQSRLKLERKSWKTFSLSGKEASRKTTLEVMTESSFDIIHFATHGFSFSYTENEVYGDVTLRNRMITSENPLLRSGIALSGINQYWNQPNLSIENETGVLTAFDVASMQLQHTSIVILSACESGIGDIHTKEGVFGLPRSFQLAGVNQVIYTLWKVDDQASSQFIQYFYNYYLRKKNVTTAFRKAQIKMSRKYDPFYWAGFVLMN